MNLKLPFHHRVYFFVRKWLIRTIRWLIAFGVFVRWKWLVFALMGLQQRLGFRFQK